MRFKDQVAVIAGASQGIGQAIAVGLGKEGAQVVVCDINEAGARETEKQIQDKGGKALAVKIDALQYDAVKAVVDRTIELFGKVDIMTCTVGGTAYRPFKDYTPELFRKLVDINLFTVFNFMLAVIGHMIERNEGKILAITSATGGLVNRAGYQVGKAGINSLVQSLASELSQTRINVNAIMPGITDTQMTRNAFASFPGGKEMLAQFAASNPRGLNKPENVAKLALWLFSDEGERITGQIISQN